MKRLFLVIIVLVAACVGGILGSIFTIRFLDLSVTPYNSIDQHQSLLTNYAPDTSYNIPAQLNFLTPAKEVTAAVVHVRTSFGSGNFSINPLEGYFDTPSRASGSGVIISDDGYIVTNNHVIEDATNIEVVMNNNQRFYARLVGADPSTDLALLKIKSEKLPYVKYGNSDNIQTGEWVLAIGNPFDLNSTVTAGIVSAKARNIGILRDKNNLQVEAFIQTDAAVNPGNSGGALVNLRGELIGINSAIATSTGSYVGYSFAIPVSLVRKVMDDLLEFGQVQRGLLGIQITDVTASLSEELELGVSQGVLVNHVNEGSAAAKSGILHGDVIISIDKHPINSVSELQEWVARNRPGTQITLVYLRDGVRHAVQARLKNDTGSEAMPHKDIRLEIGGATLEDVQYKVLLKLQLEGGVRIKALNNGKWKEAGMREGFVIGYIDKIPVNNVEELNQILDFKKGGILIEGYYPTGKKGVYGIEW